MQSYCSITLADATATKQAFLRSTIKGALRKLTTCILHIIKSVYKHLSNCPEKNTGGFLWTSASCKSAKLSTFLNLYTDINTEYPGTSKNFKIILFN